MQFGFTTKCSTTSAATYLLNHVFLGREAGLLVGCLFIDLKKAFDCVNYSQLENILLAYGISDKALNTIKSFLLNRKQYVNINDQNSTFSTPQTGVPQGSVLGPLLFLIYINDIFHLNLLGTPILYADDSTLIYKAKNLDQLRDSITQDLHCLTRFFKQINMEINFVKTKFMIFKNKDDLYFDNIPINGNIISRVLDFEYLGLVINYKLDWNSHISRLISSISRYAGTFWRLRRVVTTRTLLNLYFAYIHSRLLYMLPVWGGAPGPLLVRVQRIQSRILKCIFHKPLQFPT
jgi:hypothetical protein